MGIVLLCEVRDPSVVRVVCLFLAVLLSFFRCRPSELSFRGPNFLLVLDLLPLGFYPLHLPFVDLEI